RVTRIAHDLQQPRSRISALETAEEAARTKKGFMRDIVGMRPCAQQPARKVESSVNMGQHKLFEPQPVFGIQIAQRLPPISAACKERTGGTAILFSAYARG